MKDPSQELLGGLVDQEWMDRAACVGSDADAWFPAKGRAVKQVKRICAGCEVRAECRAYGEGWMGVWGGETEHARTGAGKSAA